MLTANFWAATIERAIKTAAQTLVALLSADNVFSIFDVDAGALVGVTALTVALSVLTSIGSSPLGPAGSPSVSVKR